MSGLRFSTFCTALLRTAEASPRLQAGRTRASPARANAFFHASRQRAQSTKPERYGTAKQPPPHLIKGKEGVVPEDQTLSSSQAENVPSAPEIPLDLSPPAEAIALPPPKEQAAPSSAQAPPAEHQAAKSPLDRVLEMDSPNQPEEDKPPHLQAPPYVHHFDTFSLVRDLQKNGFSEEQAVTVMKAVRGLLGDNMDLARRALVSQSNVENELYLFRAACSELKVEIQSNRKNEADMWRSQRGQLQHEVDILSQMMMQETSALKDELRGMFDDRKMRVRMKQKEIEAKIQELHSKITVALNSDARGEIEGIRWILTRRAAITLAIAASMVVLALNYSKYTHASLEAEQKKQAKDRADAHEIVVALRKGATQGLSEEVLLAPDGAVGG